MKSLVKLIVSLGIKIAFIALIYAIVMGLIVAVLTALLQSPIIFMFMGYMKGNWFDIYIGNQIFLLVISGMFAAYFGNAYLKQRIH